MMRLKANICSTLVCFMLLFTFSACESDEAEPETDDQNEEETDYELSGTISEETTLSKRTDDDGPDYLITGDLTIEAMVNIEPGVRLAFEEDVILTVEGPDGVLVAEGTENENIVFTTANPEGQQYWKGLRFNSSDARNKLEYVHVEYAGNSEMGIGAYSSQNRQTSIGIDEEANLTISHTTVTQSEGYGLFAWGDIHSFEDNNFTENHLAAINIDINNAAMIDDATMFDANGYDGVEIHGSVLTQESTITNLNNEAPYNIIGDIETEAPLTIAEGVTFEMDEDVLISVEESYLSVNGTSNNYVTFTTANLDGQQYWKGLRFKSSDANNKLEYAHVEYAGNSEMGIGAYSSQNRATNIGLDEDATLTLTHSTISHSNGYGIALIESAQLNESDNVYENNAEDNIAEGI